MSSPSALKAAFLFPANLVGLFTAALSSVVTQEPLPAFIALGVEALYLVSLTASPTFRRHVKASYRPRETTPEAAAALLASELEPSQAEHYRSLVALKDRILVNYAKLPGGRILAASSEGRLSTLLTSFLRLLGTLVQYRTYLNSEEREQVAGEVQSLRSELSTETDAPPRLQDIKRQRLGILEQRLSRFEQAREGREVVSHQLASIEDLLRLTHEQSIAIRDPALVSQQLDALSVEVQASDETVRELERMMTFTEELQAPLSHGGSRNPLT